MSKWLCRKQGETTGVVVDTPFFHDAFMYAQRRFIDLDRPHVTRVPDNTIADVEIEWRGTDAGVHPDRKRWRRERRPDGAWSDWLEERT